MTKFQIALLGVFGLFLVGGVIIFSVYRGGSKTAADIVIWGTVSKVDFDQILAKTSLYQSKEYNVIYEEKSEENFDQDFIEALASNIGPDVFMLPSDKIIKHRNKIFPIPYTIFTQRQFKDTFIEGAEIYMAPEGTLALPIAADPMVMYWNRAMFTAAKITEPPKYWDEFYDFAAAVSKKDGALNILQSAVAMGEFANISNAKDIMVNLASQSGTPVTMWSGDKVQSVFASTFNKPTLPAEAAINFYTEFSNPSKSSYSWNRSLPNSTSYFLSGDLALYFGFASEISKLQLKNPNLNFDVTLVPSSRDGGVQASFANFEAFAITKSSQNANAAYAVISALASAEGAQAYSETLDLPPVRRTLLGQKPADAFQSIFYDSAIRAKAWLDPSPEATDSIFKSMTESITSGRARTGEAIIKADREISELLMQQ